MNLDQIATKCFILALFIRDDGQRLLLGDGYYDFNQKLQHFQGNTIANDVVEIQGDNGQLLAGQVMRSGAQKFEGYIGDATTNRQIIEQKRSDFMAFFRIKHFYKVIYIFPDGTAIQRQRGYLTDAPTIPEIFQKFPEYSVALNFEDANYYEYAEDDHGDEIYAHIAELALAGGATGGLIWDAIGAVSNGISWSGIQTAQGEYIQVTNELDIPAKLASVEMLGKAEQDGTPTPDAPIAVQTVTGENTVKIEGKNLLDSENAEFANGYISSSDGSFTSGGGSTASKNMFYLSVGTYTFSNTENRNLQRVCYFSKNKVFVEVLTITSGKTFTMPSSGYVRIQINGSTTLQSPQLELGSTATTYEPYQGQEFEVNLGKNLFDKDNASRIYAYIQSNTNWRYYNDSYSLRIPCQPNTTYTLSANNPSETIFRAGATDSDTIPSSGVDVAIYSTTRYSDTNTPIYLTTGANAKYIVVQVAEETASDTLATLQLEKGSTATTYAPYFTPIELAKIGTYQDRIYKSEGKWYIEKQVGKVEVAISYMIDAFGLNSGVFAIANKKSGTYGALCDKATRIVSPTSATVFDGSFYENPANFIFLGSASDDLTSLRTKFNGAILYYVLATPTTTEITNEALIAQLEALESASLYLGLNNIGTETLNAVPTLKIEYYTAYTLEGAGYEWEPGGNTAKTIVTVAGVDSAWPIWTIQGGAQNPTLTNITTGQTITWQGFVPEGQTLTINMAEMTADLAGANVFEYITGEWIRLAPGNNTLVYTAGSADKPSTLSWNGVLA